MNKRHKYADVIHAWADGAEIQGRPVASPEWLLGLNPGWYEDWEYRIKPRTVKREGWVAIYSYHNGGGAFLKHAVYISEDAAKEANSNATDIIKIEWEEEV